MTGFVPRTLWFTDDHRRVEIGQAEIATFDGPVVVLGEAGMGKTSLLERIAEMPGHAWCTARQLINRRDPSGLLGDADVLVIDALDEVVAQHEGDAVDLVLRKLGDLGYPRFVLSCRVADWLSATSVAAIEEQYSSPAKELHLVPFSDEDAVAFLTDRLSSARAAEVVSHFETYGLRGFLGNPQTLEMIERVAPDKDLPRTSSELFERTIEIIWKEHRDEKARFELPRSDALDAAGAAFAAQLLTGREAISRLSAANIEEGDLPLREVEAFDSGNVQKVFGTRMFRAAGPDRFSYWHRRIGEYLGARWLAGKADTPEKRRRLLAMFHQGGLVPASLRGAHAWLAIDPDLAPSVIETDPMGVIEYGDADVLTPGNARVALAALTRVATENPGFRDRGPYRARSLVQPTLVAEVRSAITAASTPLGVKLLLLEQLQRANIASELETELAALVLDFDRSINERISAAEALAGFDSSTDWPKLVEQLRELADGDSTRMAVELIETLGYDGFDDGQIVRCLLAHLGSTLVPVDRKRRPRVVGNFTRLKRDLPLDRLEGVLDVAEEYLGGRRRHNGGPDELADVLVAFLARKIEAGGADPADVWRWLQLVRDGAGYDRRARDRLDAALAGEEALRRAIQENVILGGDPAASVGQKAIRLHRPSQTLVPSPADLLVLLGKLDPADRSDLRWREVLDLTRHSETEGLELREAAKPFAAHRADLTDWIDGLATPRVPEWEKKQERDRRKRAGKQAMSWAEHRRLHLDSLPSMRAGDFGSLINPAKSYLKQFRDMGDVAEPHLRIEEWLGPEVAAAAHEGFEAFLVARPPHPSAVEIANDIAKGEEWNARFITIAALAERIRLGRGFQDLPSERLIAGWIELRRRDDDSAGFGGLREALAAEIRLRRKWRSAQVLLIEPQLRHGGDHVEGLHELLNDDGDRRTAVDLAVGWLARGIVSDYRPERSLIATVIASPRARELAAIASAQLYAGTLPPDRHRSWLAAQLIVDFPAGVATLGGGPVARELLWDLREHLGMRRSDRGSSQYDLSPEQLAWIVRTFRTVWPAVPHPTGSSSGESNPWDATDFINWAIARLGDDTSTAGIEAIADLQTPTDGYRDYLLIVAAEQRRKVVESVYRPPSLDAVARALDGGPPTSAGDLHAVMLNAIETAQGRLKGDPLDWYKGFYREDGRHQGEETCRDELMKMLDGKVPGVEMRPEGHMADDKRVDIECSASPTIMVPVEVKGQWHKDLWSAADDQLDKLYSADWRTDRRGIYLVLWFGAGTKLTPPPAGTTAPTTPEELRASLASASTACRTGMVEIVVLDLTRP